MTAPAEAIESELRNQLYRGLLNEPGYLLRGPGGGYDCHVGFGWFIDAEQIVLVQRFTKRLPDRWLSPLPTWNPYTALDDTQPVSASFETVTWQCMNVYAFAYVAAELLPGYPHDADFRVRFCGAIYEPAR